MDWSWNRLADKKFQFMDNSLVACVRSQKDKDATEFFKLLSLCHTVMVENKEGNSNILIFGAMVWWVSMTDFLCPFRWAGVPGSFSWWGCAGDGSQELWLCVSVPYAGHHHHQWDGTGTNLWNVGATRLQLRSQANVYHLYETHTCRISSHHSINVLVRYRISG